MVLVFVACAEGASNGESSPVAVPTPSPLAIRYYETGNWIWLFREIWGLALPALFLWSRASAKLRDVAHRLGRTWFFTVAIYAALYLGCTALINLPLSFLLGFVRQHAYGLSEQTPGRWFFQWAVAQGVSILVASLLLWIPFLLIRRSPKRWWLYCSALTVPFLFVTVMIKPIWFDPLLNHYGPMHDKNLESRILALARRAGIEGGRVFEVDKSRDTKTVNAYVTGLLGTERIVLWDTILTKLNPDEVLVVMGHEMGHYVLGHLPRGIAVSALITLLGLFFLDRAGAWILRRHGNRFGINSLADVAAVPLLVLLGQVYSFAALPVGNAFSRYQEHEADRFALEITQASHSAGMSFVKLQQENLSHPRPDWFFILWRGSHPGLGERIDFSNRYHPWRTGAPLRYGAYFSELPAGPVGSGGR